MPWRVTSNVARHPFRKRENDPSHARTVGTSSSRQATYPLSLIDPYGFHSASLGVRGFHANVVPQLDLNVRDQNQHLNTKGKESRKMLCEYKNRRAADTHLPDMTRFIELIQMLAISMHSWAEIFKSYPYQIFPRITSTIILTRKYVTGSFLKSNLKVFTDDHRCSKRSYSHIIGHTSYEHANIAQGNESFMRSVTHEIRGGAYSALPSHLDYLREGDRRIFHQHNTEDIQQPFFDQVQSVMKLYFIKWIF